MRSGMLVAFFLLILMLAYTEAQATRQTQTRGDIESVDCDLNAKTLDEVTYALLKTDSAPELQKSAYIIRGENPTLWLKRIEATWKIATCSL